MVITMTITDIKPQVKDKSRCSVFIDGKFALGLSQVDVLYYKLKTGDDISRERFEYILNESVYNKAKEKAVSLLGRRVRSRREIIDRLTQDYSAETAQRVAAMLEKYGYIDDERFARAYAADGFKLKKWGRRRIEFELKNKGIDESIIDTVIDEVIDSESISQPHCAAALLQKRIKSDRELTYEERRKHTAYLAGRGFLFEDINKAFEILNITFVSERQ